MMAQMITWLLSGSGQGPRSAQRLGFEPETLRIKYVRMIGKINHPNP
jgi:hypothetical protein